MADNKVKGEQENIAVNNKAMPADTAAPATSSAAPAAAAAAAATVTTKTPVELNNTNDNTLLQRTKLKEEFKKELEQEMKFANNSNPIDRTFADVYKIIAYLCIVIFVILSLITFMDILLYSYDAFYQNSNLSVDASMFNMDTHDYKVLKYAETNTTTDEPYHVFLCEQIFAMIYVLVGITITLIGIEYGVAILLNFYNAYTGGNKDYSINLAKSKVYLIIIVISLFGAGTLTTIYNSLFVNKTQNSMYYIQDNMYNIKNLIYQNLTTDTIFLKALINDDIPTVINQFSTVLTQGIKDSDTSEAQKMICTISLYSYFTTSVPLTDISYNKIVDIFEYNNITNQDIDPTHYLYYNNYNINIQNLYPQLISIISAGLENYKGKSISSADVSKNIVDPFFGSSNSIEQSRFTSSITSQLTQITEGITSLSVNGIYDGKNKLFTYIIYSAIAAFIFLIVLLFVIWDEIPQEMRDRLVNGISTLGKNIKSIFNSFINFIRIYLFLGV